MTWQEHAGAGETSRLAGRLWVAVRRFDDDLASSVLHRALAVLPPGEVADLVVAPVLRRLGESWHVGPRMIAVEHFTCQVVRALFPSHAVGTTPTGPHAVCFSPAGDQHDLGVQLAAATLVAAGWRTVLLGADTPQASVEAAIGELEPDLVVVGACMRPAAEQFLASGVVHRQPVLAGGAGFTIDDAVESSSVVVHHGAFATVPDVAQRLLQRAGANGT